MPETVKLVDSEALVVAHLNTDNELTALVGDNIGTVLPPDLPLPDCQLFKLAGTIASSAPETVHFEHVRINFAAWAATKPEAYDVAATIIRAFLTLPDVPHALGTVTAADLELAPYWSPDPEDETPRYLFTLSAHVHPGGAGGS
jgi:hypothetical protein